MNQTNVLLQLLIVFMVFSCGPLVEPEQFEPNDNFRYYPVGPDYEWKYVRFFDKTTQSSPTISTETHHFNQFENRIDIKNENGNVFATKHWNFNNLLLTCCEGLVLADFNRLNCTTDSIVLFAKKNRLSTHIYIHQNCEPQYRENQERYGQVECIKTYQANVDTNGIKMEIIRYYGKDVGLVYEQTDVFLADSSHFSTERTTLLEHNF